MAFDSQFRLGEQWGEETDEETDGMQWWDSKDPIGLKISLYFKQLSSNNAS